MTAASNPIPRPEHAIARIAVEGFKSIDTEQVIEIAPLTVLAGANSSGKSSIMQPLLLWKQTLEAPFDPGPLLLNGPSVRFTSTEQILFRGRDRFSVEIALTKGASIRMTYLRGPERKLAIESMAVRRPGENKAIVIRPDSRGEDVLPALMNPFRKVFRRQARDNANLELRVIRSRAFLQCACGAPLRGRSR